MSNEFKTFRELLRNGNHEMITNPNSYSVFKDLDGNYFFGRNVDYERRLLSTEAKWVRVTSFANYLQMKQVELSSLKEKLYLRPFHGCSFRYEEDSIVLTFSRLSDYEDVCRYFQRMLLCVVEFRQTDDEVIATFKLGFPVIGFFLFDCKDSSSLERVHEFAIREAIEIVEGEDEQFLYKCHPFIRERLTWSDLRFIYHEGVVFFTESDWHWKDTKIKITKCANPDRKPRLWEYASFSMKNFEIWKERVKERIEVVISKNRERKKTQEQRNKDWYSHSRESTCPRCSEDPCMCSDQDLY